MDMSLLTDEALLAIAKNHGVKPMEAKEELQRRLVTMGVKRRGRPVGSGTKKKK